MKLVHTADLHLGYRAYHRTNSLGINVREADVAHAFREMLDRIIQLGPDLLLVAGDIFHSARPSNAAIADAFRQFARIRREAPETRIVIIAGNHDSPKAAEIGSILRLFNEISGVEVAHHEARRLTFADLGLSVLCLPHNELKFGPEPAIEPDSSVERNVLVAHAAIDDRRLKLLMDIGAATLARGAIDPSQWDYVALGHYHVRSRLEPNMYYPGGIERTSLNIWAEAENARVPAEDTWGEAEWGKGFVEYDLDAGSARFHKLESSRPVFDLRPVEASALGPRELDAAIKQAIEAVPGGVEGKIVRLRLFNVTRDVYRELDHRSIREYRTQALHFHLDARPPPPMRFRGMAAPGKRRTLREELEAFLAHGWKPDVKTLDRQALIELGLRYLGEAEEAEALEGRE